MLIDHGADINAVSKDKKTPLHLAKDPHVAEILMKNNADHKKDNKEQVDPPLLTAAFQGNLEVCRVLVEGGVDVNLQDERGRTALFMAVRANKAEVLSYLLSQGANPNILSEGLAPIHKAVKSRLLEMTQILADGGADINLQTKEPSPPVYHVDPWELTPVYLASKEGQVEILQFLLDKGADLSIRSEHKSTPLHVAKSGEIAQLLVEHGADVNALQIYNNTPLHYAKSAEVAKVLIENGADIHCTGPEFKRTSPPVISNDHLGVQMELIKAGVDIHSRGRGDQTILHNTIDPTVITFLVKNGLDINVKDGRGHTPRHYTCDYSQYDSRKESKRVACTLLKQYGGVDE
jgi:ankyrin repeat protein